MKHNFATLALAASAAVTPALAQGNPVLDREAGTVIWYNSGEFKNSKYRDRDVLRCRFGDVVHVTVRGSEASQSNTDLLTGTTPEAVKRREDAKVLCESNKLGWLNLSH